MEDSEIKYLLKLAIQFLLKNDVWLLVNDLSEQSISHKLAEYLQTLFTNYNVDCEYNGNIECEGNRKRISILKSDLGQLGLLKKKEEIDNEKEYSSRAVFPDVIIHKRGTNKNNLCIIEIKKSTSSVPFDYDRIKLEKYTSNYFGNDLEYQIGVFIEFITGQENIGFNITYFKAGHQIGIILK